MLEIWGRANSANVKKVLWACEELAVPHLRHEAGGAFGVVDTEAYRAMNPNGLVPVVRAGDLVLWESNTIVRWLAAEYPDGGLWIADAGARAAAEKWMDWSLSLAQPFRDVVFGLLRTAPEKRDHASIERGRATCAGLWAIADRALGEQRYFSGDRFGIADIAVGPIYYVWNGLDVEKPATPSLTRWMGELQSRPAWAKVVAIGLS